MFIGPCIIVLVEEWKTNLMSLAILFHFLCAQHASDINISIIRGLRLRCRKLLMMDILMSETCWAHKKWNKIASDIKLVFHSSTKCRYVYFPFFLKLFWCYHFHIVILSYIITLLRTVFQTMFSELLIHVPSSTYQFTVFLFSWSDEVSVDMWQPTDSIVVCRQVWYPRNAVAQFFLMKYFATYWVNLKIYWYNNVHKVRTQ